MKIAGSAFFVAVSISTVAWAGSSVKENIFLKEKGFFTCAGGSSAPLFKQDCRELTIDRISFGGGIVYEGWCLDSNGTKYIVSCSSFVFEPEKVVSNTKQNYFDK